MSFMLALPKISLHGAGAIGDMVKLVAGKQWGKALIVTDGQLVKLGLLDSLFAALDEQQMAYQLFDEVFPNPTEALVQQGYAAYQAARCDYLIAFGGGSPIDTAKAIKILTANPGSSCASGFTCMTKALRIIRPPDRAREPHRGWRGAGYTARMGRPALYPASLRYRLF